MTNRRWMFWLTVALSFFVFLFLIRSILLPFVLGILTAYFLDPAADRLEKCRLSRGMATTVITVLFFLSIGTVSVLVVPMLASQLSGLVAAMPGYMATLQDRYAQDVTHWLQALPAVPADSVKEQVGTVSGAVLNITGSFASGLLHSGMALLNLLSLIVLTPVVTFYLLRDWDRIVERFDRLLPRAHADTIRQQLRLIDQTLSGFLRGQVMVCLVMGTYYAVGLSLAGLKFGVIIGILTGLLVIVPYVGAIVGMGSGLIAALVQFEDYHQVGVVLAVFLLGQMLEGYAVTPRLVGKRVGLHPIWIIFGMLTGAALFGFVGVLIAVPTAAVIGVLIRFATARYLESTYYSGKA